MKDRKQLAHKYSHPQTQKNLWILKDGAMVVGEEVDDDNRLLYVIKKGNDITVDYASNHKPVSLLRAPKVETVTIKGKASINP